MDTLLDAVALAAAALLAALLVQPLRATQSRFWRGLVVLALPGAMLLQALAVMAVAAPRPVSLALYAVAAGVPALLPALLLARPVPAGLGPALAALGIAPGRRWLRLTLAPALPGLALGWLLALLPGLAVLVLARFPGG